MDGVVERIREELKEKASPSARESSQRFFKDEILCYGLKTAEVIKIAKKYWKEVKSLPKTGIFSLCEELYKSGYLEESFVVSNWSHRFSGRYEKDDFEVFRHWIDTYINNWASCDGFCTNTMGDFIVQYPEYLEELKVLAKSENRWMRRAAAVSIIMPARKGNYLDDAIEIADILLEDTDDMVQKGYGWLLKEESRQHTDEIFDYVMKNKKNMPRTSLRYAIELMPKDLKKEAMKKDW
nr:DNA alkylation repair protein [Methanomicrobium sp. W14]